MLSAQHLSSRPRAELPFRVVPLKVVGREWRRMTRLFRLRLVTGQLRPVKRIVARVAAETSWPQSTGPYQEA
ncbi:MAG: hypothetical protein AB1705_10755 [Verrucomicrobiota bacterium]